MSHPIYPFINIASIVPSLSSQSPAYIFSHPEIICVDKYSLYKYMEYKIATSYILLLYLEFPIHFTLFPQPTQPSSIHPAIHPSIHCLLNSPTPTPAVLFLVHYTFLCVSQQMNTHRLWLWDRIGVVSYSFPFSFFIRLSFLFCT